jgi:putative endonuclease
MFYIYILKLANGQHYVGYTTNLDNRLARHACGKACTTTERVRAESVAFYAAFASEKLARDFERYLKSSSGFAFRNKRLVE